MKAMPLVQRRFPKSKLIIAGEGDFSGYKGLIHDAKSYEIYNHFIPDEKVGSLFERSSVVVLPYKDATQSGLMSIGYAYKKPIVATNVGSIPEIVEDCRTGILVPPDNHFALAIALIKVLQHPDVAKKMGLAGYEKMKTDMDWDVIAKKTLERVYVRLLNENV